MDDVGQATRSLGLSGRPLCVHASLRSFGWAEGGAGAVVEGLLAEGCTVVVPSFSYGFAVPPPADMRPPRNGWNYDEYTGATEGAGRVYLPDSREVDPEMGAIASAVVNMPSRVRGNHPLNSFAAAGPLAHELIAAQRPLDVYAPLECLANAGGFIILMGVGLQRLTLLHLAERMAGRNLFRRWANAPGGGPMEVEAGGCAEGFDKFETLLTPLMRKTKVGQSTWIALPAKQALAAASAAIRENPDITHCGNPHCERCRDAAGGGPILGP